MPGRIDLGASAGRTLSTLTGSLSHAGDAARNAGETVRDHLRDSARALERRGRSFRKNGMRSRAKAVAKGARRNKRSVLATVGAAAGGLLAFGLLRRRARAKSKRFRWW